MRRRQTASGWDIQELQQRSYSQKWWNQKCQKISSDIGKKWWFEEQWMESNVSFLLAREKAELVLSVRITGCHNRAQTNHKAQSQFKIDNNSVAPP